MDQLDKAFEAINECTEQECYAVYRSLEVGNTVRHFQDKYQLKDSDMCEMFSIEKEDVSSFRKGTFAYNLKHISDLEYHINMQKNEAESTDLA